jgi:hypothetical protein
LLIGLRGEFYSKRPLTNNNNNNNKAEKISKRNTRQALHRLIAKNCHPGNIAHTKESAIIRSLKPEWGGAPLVQGKEHRENHVLRDDDNNNKVNLSPYRPWRPLG